MLCDKDNMAIEKLKIIIKENFSLHSMIVFGSKARGTADDDSDIDVLVLLDQPVNNTVEENVFHTAYDVELEYEVVFGIVVKNYQQWDVKEKYYPFGQNVLKDGLAA